MLTASWCQRHEQTELKWCAEHYFSMRCSCIWLVSMLMSISTEPEHQLPSAGPDALHLCEILSNFCWRRIGGVVLVILAAIDAAFSGDWSRIGILSRDAELGLRPLLGLLGLFHLACGAVTALDASQKGFNPVPQTLKAAPLPNTLSIALCRH